MLRTFVCACMLFCLSLSGFCQSSSLEQYFKGKEVTVKLDLPGTQRGVDLKFSDSSPMNWKEYSSRIKANGVSIHKGDVARITNFVVKKDMIELQLDGGGFGTFGDDSTTTVSPRIEGKSDYERDLERQLDRTTDPEQRRRIQNDLDRARSKRESQNSRNSGDAQIASQIKAQQVADKRLRGGSRFNLRWQGTIPPDLRNPEAVMSLLAEYLSFDAPGQMAPSGSAEVAQKPDSPVSQLHRGMTVDEVAKLLGQGKLLSESVSADGLKTQVYEYSGSGMTTQVTCVEGVVIKYSMASH
ncbi:MAG: hypothetical protein PW789_05600 [Edaphobacter sp.]|uniref:hypothetical protein n=1 Tax=Edaphobacter sp. TaxID=1934404 RepID=UPI002391680C|nr:hypothetical protein [Edaphobacter sp.]MDE1176065.1 hypothetical protein [Edaphobacter sp.]